MPADIRRGMARLKGGRDVFFQSGGAKERPARAGMRVLKDVLDDGCAVHWARVQLPGAAGRRNLETGAGLARYLPE